MTDALAIGRRVSLVLNDPATAAARYPQQELKMQGWAKVGTGLGGLVLVLTAATASAAISPERAAKLGDELTPVGANPEGNAAGTIPPWEGAEAWIKEEKNWTYEDLLRLQKNNPDRLLFTSRRPDLAEVRFTITADNYKQYADKLAAGYERLFKLYPESYHMNVYPTVRGTFFPDEIYKWTQYNATHAKLEGCANCITGAKFGFPFPIPTNGAQVIWNHKLKFRGNAVTRYNDQAVVDADGSFYITKLVENVRFEYANLLIPDPMENMIFMYTQRVLAPPRLAGQVALVHENFGLNGSGRNAWIYNPGLDRVTRAPDVGFDTPSSGSDGLQFNDQIDMFNGSLSRYNWKLKGKKAMLIPYNSVKMSDPRISYEELLGENHLNQKYARYELHRVWIVEATVRPSTSHQIARRVFYVDEDGWQIVLVDCYDNRGELWRFQEGHAVTVPFLPTITTIPEVIYDLKSGRYFVTALSNENKPNDFSVTFDRSFFQPRNLVRLGRRY